MITTIIILVYIHFVETVEVTFCKIIPSKIMLIYSVIMFVECRASITWTSTDQLHGLVLIKGRTAMYVAVI